MPGDALIERVHIQHYKPSVDDEFLLVKWNYNQRFNYRQETIHTLQLAIGKANVIILCLERTV